MMEKRIGKNYLIYLFYQIMNILTPLITTPHVARALGASQVGNVSFAESMASYFVLFAGLGIAGYGQREISFVRDSVPVRRATFWNIKIFQFITGGTALLAWLVFTMAFAGPDARTLWLVMSLEILGVTFDTTWFFQGMEDFAGPTVRNCFFRLLRVALILLLVKEPGHAVRYALITWSCTLSSRLSLLPRLRRYLGGKEEQSPGTAPAIGLKEAFSHLVPILLLFVPTIAIQVYTVLDKSMIGLITQDSYQNGYYEQATKIVRMAQVLVASVAVVSAPRTGYYYKQNRMDEMRGLLYQSYTLIWVLGMPVFVGLFAIADSFVPVFFGPGYEGVTPLLRILCVLVLIIGISNVTGNQFLVPSEKHNLLTLSVTAGAVANLLMNLLLIPKFQAIGAAAASVGAEIVVTGMQFYLVRRDLKLSMILKPGLVFVPAALLMGAVVRGVRYLLPAGIRPDSIRGVALMIGTGILVYGAEMLVLYRKRLLPLDMFRHLH